MRRREVDRWWAPRWPHEKQTSEFLGRVLEELGATELAAKARAKMFDRFRPSEDVDGREIDRLILMVGAWARSPKRNRQQRRAAGEVAMAAALGEFNATDEEARLWLQSADGQAQLARLFQVSPAAPEPDLDAAGEQFDARCLNCGAPPGEPCDCADQPADEGTD